MGGAQFCIGVQGAFCASNETHEIHMYRFSLRAGRLNADATSVGTLAEVLASGN